MSNPKILRIEEVQLLNLEDKENKEIDRIDYEGADLLNAKEVKNHTEDGEYVMKGISAKVLYDEAIMTVSVSTSQTMSYAKVEDAGNRQKAMELENLLRDRFLQFFRK